MSTISIRRAHALPHDAAVAAADKIVAGLAQKYGIRSQWQGDLMHIDGGGVKGTLQITPDKVAVDLTLGMMAAMFKGVIAENIEQKIDEVFGAA